MKLCVDTEITTYATGNAFSRRNHLCCVSVRSDNDGVTRCIKWEHNGEPVSADNVSYLQDALNRALLVIGFAIKFDLHWLRRCGIIEGYSFENLQIWDCQLAQFVIQCQSERYPSLDKSCAYFNLGQKSTIIEKEYWDRGIDTDQVPWEILEEYANRDVDLTWELYQAQQKYLTDKPALLRLIKLSCMDTLVLAEMEYNGLKYDVEESLKRAAQKQQEIDEIERQVKSICRI